MMEDDPDPELAWRILVRLAELGAVGAGRIERFEARQPSAQARTGAARALAAMPTTEAKARAWEVFSADEVDNRVFHAVGLGLWTPEQAALSAPYVERYLNESPIWAARRGQGFSRTVGGVFPMHAVAETTREGLRTALDGEVPTVLRRAWNDRLDDLELDLRVRRARRTSR